MFIKYLVISSRLPDINDLGPFLWNMSTCEFVTLYAMHCEGAGS